MGKIVYDGEGMLGKAKKFASRAAEFLGVKSDYLDAEPMKETDYHVVDIDFAMKDIGTT